MPEIVKSEIFYTHFFTGPLESHADVCMHSVRLLRHNRAVNLPTAVMLRATEERALRKYMDMEPLKAMNSNSQF